MIECKFCREKYEKNIEEFGKIVNPKLPGPPSTMKDLTSGHGKGRNYFCETCESHYYNPVISFKRNEYENLKWFSKKEWDDFVESPKFECIACGDSIPDFDPKMCCSGHECGCLGKPTEPQVCSNKCYDQIFKKEI